MNRIKFGVLASTLAICTIAMAAPKKNSETKDIVDTAVAAGSFQTLAKALQAADLVDTLKGPGPFTVFAPTDEAFAKLPAGTWTSCSNRKTRTSCAPFSPITWLLGKCRQTKW